jgi:hypothetical protein
MKKTSSVYGSIKNKIFESSSLPENSIKLSYSQYTVFKGCPYRWHLTYQKKMYPFSASIDTVFGTALHETLQEYLTLLFNSGIKASNSLDFNEFLLASLKKAYKDEIEKNEGKHFTTKDLLGSYYDDGILILNWIRKNRVKLFDVKNTDLVGTEIPILLPIQDRIWFTGFVDVILYDKIEKKYTIIDIKTSKEGWKDYAKKDELKISQLLLYKRFFSKQFEVSEDDIDVKFMICKRKVWEDSPYPIPRVQHFIPANGTAKVNKAISDFQEFINECYGPSSLVEGKTFNKTPGKNFNNCRFCPFSGSEFCDQKEEIAII